MSPELQKILADLPTIQKIARQPGSTDPLLRLCLAQAKALDEIAAWAANAERIGRVATMTPVDPPSCEGAP